MDLNGVINLVQQSFGKSWTRADVRAAINQGIALPTSGTVVRLEAHFAGGRHDVDDDQLDRFFARFEAEEPGRYIPTAVRRALLVEAHHACGICEDSGPIEFHHIVEFNRLGHHDPRQMIALCPTCHTKSGNGEIDRLAQEEYKRLLVSRQSGRASGISVSEVIRFNWDDLREVVEAVYSVVVTHDAATGSAYDFTYTDIEVKDDLNGMGEAYSEVIQAHHLPHFAQIRQFLGSPANGGVREMYYELVDELRSRVAADPQLSGVPFEAILIGVCDRAVAQEPGRLRGRRRTLNVLLSFMYATCDIGRKVPAL